MPETNVTAPEAPHDKDEQPKSSGTTFAWVRAALPATLAILVSIAVVLLVTHFRDQVESLKGYGYLGAFLIGFLGNASIILPAPSIAFTAALGIVFNPLLVGLAAGSGEALGEMTAYLAGLSGNAVVENHSYYDTIQRQMERHGAWVFFVLAVIPNPLFDIAGIAAGMVRFPIPRFLMSVWAGKTIKSVAVAAAGRHLF